MSLRVVIAIVGAIVVSVLPTCNAYGLSVNPNRCPGQASCTGFINSEYGILSSQGEIIGCLYGQTEANQTESTARCVVPCDFDVDVLCQCVSQADARIALREESALGFIIGVICFIGILMVCGCQCYRTRKYSSQVEQFLAEYQGEKDSKRQDQMQMISPTPPSVWLCYLLYLVFLGLGLLFLITGIGIVSRSYWTGCGEPPVDSSN